VIVVGLVVSIPVGAGSATNVPSPSTSILVPSNGATLSGSTYLDASATNATSVEFVLFGGIYGFSPPVVCTATPTLYGWLCAWNTKTVPNNSYVLVAVAFGAGGTSFSTAVNVSVQNPQPTTSVLVPSDGAVVSGTTYLDASASNAANVAFLLFGGIYGEAVQLLCTATLTPYGWLCAWDTTTVPNDTYGLVSGAVSPAGEAFSSSISITVSN
jgi:hypothetical protein